MIKKAHKEILKKRIPRTHKGDYGRVYIIAGSLGMTGAAYLCSQAAIFSGSGLVTLAIPKSLNDILETKLTEVITDPQPETKKGTFSLEAFSNMKKAISESDVGLVGCGLGKHPDLVKLVEKIILTSKIPLVLDGDGLNAISKDVDILKEADCPIIITPHPGEMSRLIDKPIDQIQDNRTEVAKRFASDYNVTVVLKGHRTIVAKNNKEYYINKTGNPGMATAGSGDVLAGMIASFLGQKIGIYGSCKLGVYLHGLSGDIAASKKGQISLIASDILENISEAFNKM